MADALALPILRRALPEVLAGESSLDRPLRWVHVLDVDPAGLLRGGELVLSTGAGPGRDATRQRHFVRALAEERAAGLVIELGMSYRQALPPALVSEAEAQRLPLIALHRPVRFVDVTEAIHGALVDRQLALLRRGQETGERLTGLVLDRRGLPDLLREIARTVGNPVVLENLANQLVAFAVHQSTEEEVLEAREEHRMAADRGATSGRGWHSAELRVRGEGDELVGQVLEHDRVADGARDLAQQIGKAPSVQDQAGQALAGLLPAAQQAQLPVEQGAVDGLRHVDEAHRSMQGDERQRLGLGLIDERRGQGLAVGHAQLDDQACRPFLGQGPHEVALARRIAPGTHAGGQHQLPAAQQVGGVDVEHVHPAQHTIEAGLPGQDLGQRPSQNGQGEGVSDGQRG